jgi:mannose-6-phosphate isomerase-like protein (cupin superfamily)
MDIFKIDVHEDAGPGYLRLNLLKTDKVAFNVYSFQPWKALSMHRHPDSDEIYYVIEGSCLIYAGPEHRKVEANHGAYIPSDTMHAILSCGSRTTLLSVLGPTPICSIYGKGLEYFCPRCELETPVSTGTGNGAMVKCPRCRTTIRLTSSGEAFAAEIVEKPVTKEARA